MNIYLLRHGETDENKNNLYYGTLDSGLNDAGKLQALRAGELLRGIGFDKVIISDRKRTRETAEVALGKSLVGMHVDKRINELDFGCFEGMSYIQIQNKFPEEFDKWIRNWKEFAPPAGESFTLLYKRVSEFMEDLKGESHENVLVVTHGGVIRTIYCYILGGNLDAYWKFSSRNGDLSIIKYEYDNMFIDSITHV